MVSLEDIFKERKDVNIEIPSVFRTINDGSQILKEKKILKECGKIGDLEKIGKALVIKVHDIPVRKITVEDKTIMLDACIGEKGIIHLPKETPVYYEEWFLDRGSYLFLWKFENEERLLKLATEFDKVDVINQ